MRATVDVLSMSATPIPRTLYMALTGARDMSVIETAPTKIAIPIQTIVKTWPTKKSSSMRSTMKFAVAARSFTCTTA